MGLDGRGNDVASAGAGEAADGGPPGGLGARGGDAQGRVSDRVSYTPEGDYDATILSS